jgi:hypothetical protein
MHTRGERNTPSKNVFAAVDFEMKFTSMLAGWGGSAHDEMIFTGNWTNLMASKSPRVGSVKLMPDMLVALEYSHPLCQQGNILMSSMESSTPKNANELFNITHSNLTVMIESAFAALKNRFKILDQKPFHTVSTQVKLFFAFCILHN